MAQNITVDMSRFNKGLGALVRDAKLNAKTVIPKEIGELERTLVNFTWPRNLAQSRAKISRQVDKQFGELSLHSTRDISGARSKTYPDTVWTGSSPGYLFGIAETSDMRKASIPDLRAVYYRTRMIGRKGNAKKARQIYKFNNRNTSQRIAVLQEIVTTDAKKKQLAARIQKNLGRMKAGWLVATFSGRIPGVQAPQWVSRHQAGARGRYEDNLNDSAMPNFAIANSARGISRAMANGIAQRAVNIRGRAMATNARLFMAGKKNLADYG